MSYITIQAKYDPITQSIPLSKKDIHLTENNPNILITFLPIQKTERNEELEDIYNAARQDLKNNKNILSLDQLQKKYA